MSKPQDPYCHPFTSKHQQCLDTSEWIPDCYRTSPSRRRLFLGFCVALAAAVSCCATVSAKNEGAFAKRDIAGSADHPLLKRIEGSYIVYYARKAYDEYKIALDKVTSAQYNFQKVEGSHTTLIYALPKDASTFEVVHAYQGTLGDVEVLFQGYSKDDELGNMFFEEIYKAGYDDPSSSFGCVFNDEFRYMAAKVTRQEGDLYVTIWAVFNTAYAFNTLKVSNAMVLPPDCPGVRLDIIETKPMKQRLVKVTADEMSSEIAKAGHATLYGILFDFNKAELKPESGPVLQEIGRLLQDKPELKLVVTGHTDAVGGFDFNRDLSQRRSAAVVTALATRYRVAQGS